MTEIDKAAIYLGFKDQVDWESKHPYTLKTYKNWRSEHAIHIYFKDPLFKAITGYGDVSYPLDAEFTKTFNKRIKYKNKQLELLEDLKNTAYNNIIEFIHKAFSISKDLIKISDIKFEDYYGFTVANEKFNYEAVIKDRSFRVINYSYSTFEDSTNTAANIIKYYTGTDIKDLSNG